MRSRPIVAWTLLLAGLVLGGSASAAGPERHSGTVVTLDPTDGVLVIDEVGPWRVERGETVLTRRTIRYTPSTRFNVFIRIEVPGRFTGDFLEVELEPADIAPGEFVTAECVRERTGLVARTATLADTDHPPGGVMLP
jgi:hypothetical protein